MSRGDGFIETYTGGRFYPFDPQPGDVRLADVAGGLAHTCRFGGHCRRFYSVAEHSIHVARELADRSPRVRLHGLLHDAGEAYLGDVPRPVKHRFDGIEAAEREIRSAVWTALEVPPPTDEEWAAVMDADDRMLAYEASTLLADGSWAGGSVDLGYELGGLGVEAVRTAFVERVTELCAEV